jgi:hypothetical protein
MTRLVYSEYTIAPKDLGDANWFEAETKPASCVKVQAIRQPHHGREAINLAMIVAGERLPTMIAHRQTLSDGSPMVYVGWESGSQEGNPAAVMARLIGIGEYYVMRALEEIGDREIAAANIVLDGIGASGTPATNLAGITKKARAAIAKAVGQ